MRADLHVGTQRERDVFGPCAVDEGRTGGGRLVADNDRVLRCVDGRHEGGLAESDAKSAALANREMVHPVVPPEHAAFAVDDWPRAHGRFRSRFHERRILAGRHEAELLALALFGAGQAACERFGTNLFLQRLSERQHEPREVRGVERMQIVALVFSRVAARMQHRSACLIACHARIVSGGDRRGAESFGEAEELAHFDRAVAPNARAWRGAFEVGCHERLDDGAREEFASVEGVVRDAQEIRDKPCVMRVFGGTTTGLLRRSWGIVPEVERYADGIVAGIDEACGGYRRIDAPRHCDEHPASRCEAVAELLAAGRDHGSEHSLMHARVAPCVPFGLLSAV